MIFKETRLAGAYIVDLKKIEDDRGFFARTWCQREFADHGLAINLAQANVAYSRKKYTLRGLHFQRAPHAEAKLVRCVSGAVFDVIVDLRSGSPTFKQWVGVELSAENHTMLYVPEDCAHGYMTLTENAELFYLVSEFYTPDCERGYRWDDSAFSIEWPYTENLIISDKDKSWPAFIG